MIPVLIALGLVGGRWWRATLAVGIVVWVIALLATDPIAWYHVPAAAGLALLNTGVGVLVHQATLRIMRLLRSDRGHPEAA